MKAAVSLILRGAFAAVLALIPVTASAAEWVVTPLYSFDGTDTALGDDPRGSLAADADKNLYGATEGGGAGGYGTIFKLAQRPNGSWKLTRLYSFVPAKGAYPQSGVVFGPDGALYGTTTTGGTHGGGTVYRLANTGGVWRITILHHFDLPGGEGKGNRGTLAFDKDGNVYGTTVNNDGNFPGDGIIYRLKRPATAGGRWVFKVLHAFAGNADGLDPESGVTFGGDGELYGLTGGSFPIPGTLYRLTPNAAGSIWTHQVLHYFNAPDGGRYPTGTLARDANGTLYGVTYKGGLAVNFQEGGFVFSYDPSGDIFKVLYRFQTTPNDGYQPLSGPILRSGALYGVTTLGGTTNEGTVFRLTTRNGATWKETVLRNLNGPTEGSGPRGPLLLNSGRFYGTAENEGPNGGGTVFLIAPPPP